MKTSSAKAKGRRCAQEVKALLHYYEPGLEDGDITVTPSGVSGPDLHLSPLAINRYPFQIECKNQERLQIWQALEQAESFGERTPVLFFRRNRSVLYCALTANDFIRLMKARDRNT